MASRVVGNDMFLAIGEHFGGEGFYRMAAGIGVNYEGCGVLS